MKYFIAILIALNLVPAYARTEPVVLDGHHLSIAQLVAVAKQHRQVVIDPRARKKVIRSHQLLLAAAARDIPVYGLNRGVGLNKDKTIFKGKLLTPSAKQASMIFNMNDIYATSASVGPKAKPEVVRAAILARLNTLLLGQGGVQVALVDRLADFLNHDITPIFPARGSIGEADITILAHLGLALAGIGDVDYQGQRMPAKKAIQKADLKPLQFYGKDALALFSSNAYTAGMAALTVHHIQKLLDTHDLLVALSLEAINGNTAPFYETVQALRPYPGQAISAQKIRQHLLGSYLNVPSGKRALQDPLSFRTASSVSGAARSALLDVQKNLTLQLNSSDDNPAVIVDIQPKAETTKQEKRYYVTEGDVVGAVIPTANFDPLPWVLSMERLNIAMGHLAASSTQRIVKLSSFCINQLSRFLSPDKATIAFAAIQKPIMFLNTEIQQLTIPVSTISYPVAGGIEDTATNSQLVVEHMQKITDNLYQILGFELLHSSQAISLRMQDDPKLALGVDTTRLYQRYRQSVPFLEKDRPLSPDIAKSNRFIRDY